MSSIDAERQRLKTKYRELVAVVSGVIAEWDPYSLLREGAPSGEWEPEVARVVAEVDSIRSATDASRVISQVFSAAFESSAFGVEACQEVGARLFDQLKAHGHVGER